MARAPTSIVLGLAGLALLLAGGGPCSAQHPDGVPPPALLPPTCPLAVEFDDLPAVRRGLREARRLFGSGTIAEEGAEDVEGDDVTWVPADALAAALIQTFQWPSDPPVRAYLASWLATAEGPVAAGWMEQERSSCEPVVIFRDRPELPADWPPSLCATRAHGYRIVAAEPRVLDGVKAHLDRLAAGGALPETRSSGACRVRLRPRALLDRMSSGSAHTLATLRHFLVEWPEQIDIEWRAGREAIRVTASPLAHRLAPTGPIASPPFVRCSIQWTGRLGLPGGLEGLAVLLESDPLGIGAAVFRAWPASPPGRDLLARELSGRFQVMLVRAHYSVTPVPVVGLELVSAKRGVAVLDRLLVASGLCDRLERDPVPYTYVRRLPATLRANRMLMRFFRYHGPQRRQYAIGVSGNWVWLGPLDDVQRVLGARHGDDRPFAAAPVEEAGDDPPPEAVAGELAVDLYALWEHLAYQQQFIDRDATRRDSIEEKLSSALGKLAGVMRRLVFEVTRDGDRLVFTRETALHDSLLAFFAARAYRYQAVIDRAEREVREEVRAELLAIRDAQLAFHRREGRYAATLDGLTRAGLWRDRKDRGQKSYLVGVRVGESSFLAFALPLDAALAARRRPAYAMGGDGILLAGPSDPDGPEARLASGPDRAGWRRLD